MRRLIRSIVILGFFAAAFAAMAAPPYVDSLAFIARAAAMPGLAGQLADWRAQAFIADPIQQIPTRHGPIDVRRYRPASGPSRRTVTLVPGVHMDGIREARLVGMAEDLAASGFEVLTVATPDLQRFRITPTSTDIIEDAAKWLASTAARGRRRQDRDARHQLLGRTVDRRRGTSRATRRVAFVMSFGGHGDLQRVMRYLCSGNAPAMPALGDAAPAVSGAEHVSIRPPHDYGVAVVLLSLAERIVPAGSGRAAAEGHPDVSLRLVARHGRQATAEIEFTAGA